jgi:hypothetical protein
MANRLANTVDLLEALAHPVRLRASPSCEEGTLNLSDDVSLPLELLDRAALQHRLHDIGRTPARTE